MIHKPTVPEVLPLVRALYARHSAGCCWHVVLDDGNTARHFVMATMAQLLEAPCEKGHECNALAIILPMMSRTQIIKLAASSDKRPV